MQDVVSLEENKAAPWYAGVTRYQWMVLVLASAGWVFDVFEGQIFNITRKELLAEILKVPLNDPSILKWGDNLLAVFLVGGTLGGVFFGSLADKWGRRPTMVLTILMYSVFSGLTYFATEIWHVAALRFLVATGVGGEWAVAAALVAEVFPPRARAHASGIFHATSVLGIWLAAVAGLAVGTQWRYAYLVGVVPAILILWIRSSVEEPQSWRRAKDQVHDEGSAEMGSLSEVWRSKVYRRRAFCGAILAAVGLAGLWAIGVAGQELAQDMLMKQGVSDQAAIGRAKFAYGIIQTAGGGVGLLSFGPLCVRLGRRRAFALAQFGAMLVVPATCYLPRNYNELLLVLPILGAFTLGLHAGYAVYFPELFPTRLRATGTGLCFNGGRLLAAGFLGVSGWLKKLPGMELQAALSALSLIYLVGLAVLWLLPETKDQPLED